MSVAVLTTPIKDEDLIKLKIKDILYLNGTLITSRDAVHQRVIRHNQSVPYDLSGKAIFHAGPIMRAKDSRFEVVSIGPTTSMRMEKYEKEFLEKTGVKIVIGKGGMGFKTAEACKEFKAIHAVFPGGCAVLAASQVEEVESVEWRDLGMPEAMWVMRVKDFGPLIVSIDTHGNNLFERNKRVFDEKKEVSLAEIFKHVDYIV